MYEEESYMEEHISFIPTTATSLVGKQNGGLQQAKKSKQNVANAIPVERNTLRNNQKRCVHCLFNQPRSISDRSNPDPAP